MGIETWLLMLALGAVCGLLGQGLRAIVGLHKSDVLSNPGTFDPVRLVVSLFIGAVAGSLATLSLVSLGIPLVVGLDQILMLIAAGYAGTDFIEGFISRISTKI